MIRKHNRRAAKAAFTIAFGVALVLGGAAAAPAAENQATPIIVGAKNFPEQYVLGQLYKQALEAKGFDVQYKENIGSTELIDSALRNGKVTIYPEYTGIMLSVTFERKTLPKTAAGTYALAKRLYEKRGQTLLRQTPFQDRDVIAVTRATARKYGLKTIADLKKVPDLTIAGFPEWETRWTGPIGKQYGVQGFDFVPALRHLRVHAARRGEGARRGRVHDRPAAPLDQVRAARRPEEHVRLPARRAGREHASS